MPKPRKPKVLALATALHPREVFAIAERLQPGAVLGVAAADNSGHVAITYAGLRISRDLHPEMKKACSSPLDVVAEEGAPAIANPDALDVVAVSIQRETPGFSLRVLELPPHIAAQYTVHASAPDVLGNGLDQARAILKEVQG